MFAFISPSGQSSAYRWVFLRIIGLVSGKKKSDAANTTVYKSRSHHEYRISTTRTRCYFPCFPRKRTKSHVSLTCSKAADTISSTALNHFAALFGLNGTEVLHMKFVQCIIFFDAPLTHAALFTISSRRPPCAHTLIFSLKISARSYKMYIENRIYFTREILQFNP